MISPTENGLNEKNNKKSAVNYRTFLFVINFLDYLKIKGL
ncbi:DNA topoisomerase domain protein [Haemophilus influenzae]|nr:DNA topoisomerase domain protein [Haemophilus influenzae]AVJ02104.1 DNA topoisomerase domain protein [Haemophilus influenzae]